MALDIDKGPGSWIFNNSLLDDVVFSNSIKLIVIETVNNRANYQGDENIFWDMLKQKMISFSKEYSKKKASDSKRDLFKCNKELEYLESLPQGKLNDVILKRIDFLSEKIANFQTIKLRGSLLRSKIPKFEENEHSISFLNNLEKRRGEENTIYSIFDEVSNSIESTSLEIKETIYTFYSELYKMEDVDISFQREFLEKIDKKISEEDRDVMDADFSESELFESLKSLQDNKSPGFDGLTKEFYVFFLGPN